MSALKPITIMGGGLAGLSLGIGLVQHGIQVELFEAGRYPRHRVCGEFISGRGQHSLERLGLRHLLISGGARFAKTAAFFSKKISYPQKNLPEPALCLSRYVLDDILAQEFSRRGGRLHLNERWTGNFADGTVRATGRRVQNAVGGWRYFGLKVHAQNVELSADLEMHFVPGGYVGLCQLAGGEVNVCGLFRTRAAVTDLAKQWREWLRGPQGSPLYSRLSRAAFEEASFCSVAGLSIEPQRATGTKECSLGDSLTMIPPVTGNGMSMAFESAELAVGPIKEYCAGTLSWAEAQAEVARRCDEAFAARLTWARRFQKILFQTTLCGPALFFATRFPGMWPAFFSLTR
ncbi:MAG: FAD-dependent monooxygenase [Verrucomicrobiota bacterium]